MVFFCAWHVKNHINKHFASFHPQALLLLLKEVEKTGIFTQKWLDHLITYDVISRKHSNWPSLNLSQNVREGWTNSYWRKEKAQKNPRGGGAPPPPPYVRGVLNELINRRRFKSHHVPQYFTVLIQINKCFIEWARWNKSCVLIGYPSHLARSEFPALVPQGKLFLLAIIIINPLLNELVRSRWPDIDLVIFLRFHWPRLGPGP